VLAGGRGRVAGDYYWIDSFDVDHGMSLIDQPALGKLACICCSAGKRRDVFA
jgi:hypothetical protein